MTDITVIILQKDEMLHIERCLTKLALLEAKKIYVVDSGSTDGCSEFVKSMSEREAFKNRLELVYHEWPGNQAAQFNWAIDTLPIETSWILRIDADEYIYRETIKELKKKIAEVGDDKGITSFTMTRARRFMGHDIKHGRSCVDMVRIFRTGYGRSTDALMDEHIVTSEGASLKLQGLFVDDSLSSFEAWQEKHRGYAKREAMMVIRGEMNPNKVAYYKLPRYLRAFAYFVYRHYVCYGFLDGIPGLRWDFWQGLWYRCLVDHEIGKMQKRPTSWSMEGFFWILGGFLRRGVRMGAKSAKRGERPKDRPIVVVQVLKTLGEVYGGPSRAVQGLTAALEEAGVETHLVSIEGGAKPWVEGIKHYHAFDTTSPKIAYEKMVKLIKELNPDFVHTNDCWMPILDACNRAARDCGVPYLLSPHGSLKRWSRNHKKIKKWFGLKVYQGYNLARAVALNTTSDDEHQHVAELGYNANVLQVTNGLSFPTEEQVAEAKAKLKPRTKKRAIFLSRIHYTKGLMNLVEAWAKVRPDDWEMEIVGTDADGYQAVIEARVKELGLEGDFIFSGAVDEAKKWEKYYNSDLFVLPTFTENFGIVVAEALYAGVPAITTKGAPWSELESEKCGWWIEVGVEPLVEALRAAFQTSSDEMRAMGERGHNLVVTRYSWKALGEQMKAHYKKLLSGRDEPQ